MRQGILESQELLQLVLETLPVGVAVMNQAGDIALINDASKRMWGGMITAGRDRWGQTKGYWHDSGKRIDPGEWASVRALSKGEISLNELIDIETYDGQHKIIRNSAAPVRNGEGLIVGAVIVNEDVTKRVRAEEALKQSETKLKEAQELAHIGYWERDLITDRITWSEETRKIFGLELPNYFLTQSELQKLIHPDDRQLQQQALARALKEKKNYDVEYRILRPTGEIRFVHVRDEIEYDETGKPIRMFGAVQDVTERKCAEEALREAHQRLRILSRRRVQIQEEERRRLARELHDQIGQLLTAAKINVQSGKALSHDSALDAKLVDTARILDSVLQEVRKISFSLRPPVLDDLGLAPALRWMLSESAGLAGLKAEFSADSNLNRADAESETACYRVAVEAVTNSIRHAGASKIMMELRNIDHSIELRVCDDGRGFDVNRIERTAERERLGLSGMRERAFAVGGRFEVKSEPGKGTEVIADFPLSSAPDFPA